MKYPTLTQSKTKDLSTRLTQGAATPNWELERTWVGDGEEVDLAPLSAALGEMKVAVDAAGKDLLPEAIEGQFAGAVHKALRELPIPALDDPGFWRYLSLVEFWWFVVIREEAAIGRGNVMTYVGGGRECVPFRMFLRGQAIRKDEDYSLAGAIPQATDFWRSHILRVKTGTAPPLARSFAQLQVEKKMVSNDVRPFARRLNLSLIHI